MAWENFNSASGNRNEGGVTALKYVSHRVGNSKFQRLSEYVKNEYTPLLMFILWEIKYDTRGSATHMSRYVLLSYRQVTYVINPWYFQISP